MWTVLHEALTSNWIDFGIKISLFQFLLWLRKEGWNLFVERRKKTNAKSVEKEKMLDLKTLSHSFTDKTAIDKAFLDAFNKWKKRLEFYKNDHKFIYYNKQFMDLLSLADEAEGHFSKVYNAHNEHPIIKVMKKIKDVEIN